MIFIYSRREPVSIADKCLGQPTSTYANSTLSQWPWQSVMEFGHPGPEFQWCGWSLTLYGPRAAMDYFSLVTWLGSNIWHNQRQQIFAQASGKWNHCFSAVLHLWGYKIWSHWSTLVSRDLLSEQGSRAKRWQKGDQVLSLIKLCLEIIFWKNQLFGWGFLPFATERVLRYS